MGSDSLVAALVMTPSTEQAAAQRHNARKTDCAGKRVVLDRSWRPISRCRSGVAKVVCKAAITASADIASDKLGRSAQLERLNQLLAGVCLPNWPRFTGDDAEQSHAAANEISVTRKPELGICG